MSTKSKLIIGIVIIVIGAGMVPTGLVTNEILRSQIYDGVPDALLGIKAEAIPTIEESIPVLGTPEVLKGVFDEASAGIEPMLKVKSTPDSLLGLKATINSSLPSLIDGVTTANIIATSLAWAESTYGAGNGSEHLFNDVAYVDGWAGLLGVTNYINTYVFAVANLSFTQTAQDALLNTGYFSSFMNDYWSAYFTVPVPGLISDLDMGSGVNYFNDYYWNADYFANYSGTNYGEIFTDPVTLMESGYNATWFWQLSAVAYWLDFIIQNYVPGAFLATYGITTAEAAATGFYRQWANGTFVSDGIDIGGGLKGFEVGVPNPSNISLATCKDLWNVSLPYTFVTEDGLMAWLGAAADNATLQTLLMSTFSLTSTQLTMLLTWIGNFVENITPELVLASTGKTISELSTLAFYEQWANGTIFGEVVIPDGFLGESDASWAGAPYFEVGLPTASGLSLAESIMLWNPLLDKTFIYGESFQNLWFPAMQGDATSQGTLISIFGVSAGELTAILTWIGSLLGLDPKVGRINDLIESNTGMTLTQIATSYFYDQWVNGTVDGEVFLSDGFLSQLDPPIAGPPYFEVGLMYSTGINITQTLALWDTNSAYSLVTLSGINRWYQAVEGNAVHTSLKAQNGALSDLQMAGILAWLPQFRDVIVNKLAKVDMNLPQEPYELGQTLAISLGAGGAVLATLGVVFLILSRRK